MSPPSDGARPVALWTPGAEPEQMRECDGTEAETTFYVLAADYDALREEVDRWRDRVSVMSEHVQSQIDKTNEQRTRAEAAEAKVARVQRLAGPLTYAGKWANADDEDQVMHLCAEQIRAALNEGDGE